jgi:hypothetical protein
MHGVTLRPNTIVIPMDVFVDFTVVKGRKGGTREE